MKKAVGKKWVKILCVPCCTDRGGDDAQGSVGELLDHLRPDLLRGQRVVHPRLRAPGSRLPEPAPYFLMYNFFTLMFVDDCVLINSRIRR